MCVVATVLVRTLPFINAADVNSTSLRGAVTHGDGPVDHEEITSEMANRSHDSNDTLSTSWWGGWHHGSAGETCCMCSAHMGITTLLYSAEDYHHFYGSHDARWQCLHECPRKCESDWHHGRYFGCYDESHLMAMDRMYGHRDSILWAFW